MIRSILLLLVSTYTCIAQDLKPGFIRTLEGVDIAGLVGRPTRSGECEQVQFKASTEDSLRLYSAKEITAFGLATGELYTAINTKRNCTFMKILVEGPLTLVLGSLGYFLYDRDKDEFTILDYNGREYQKVLRREMSACPLVSTRASKTKLEAQSLIAIVTDYNNCVKESMPNYKGLPPQASVAVMIGYNSSKCRVAGEVPGSLDGGPMKDQATFTGGLDLTLRKNAKSPYFGFYCGLYYAVNNYHKYNEVVFHNEFPGVPPSNPDAIYHELTMRYHELKFPVALEYRKPSSSRFPYYVRVGASFSAVLNVKSSRTADLRYGDEVYAEPTAQLETVKHLPQVYAGVGLEYQLRTRLHLRIGATSTLGGGRINFTGDETVKVTISSFSILTGLAF